MRIFVIADASKRKARPIGILIWESDESSGREKFSLEISPRCDKDDLPLSLSFCAEREGGAATPTESERWVRSRIVPEDRHNISEVLRANGLAEYDVASLLAASKGRSSDDDLLVHEIYAPDGALEEFALSESTAPNTLESRADRVIDAVERRRRGGEYHYAFAKLPEPETDGSPEETVSQSADAAHRIGKQIREQRHQAGLTQKQLAAKVGITQSILSRVESGNGNPTLSLLEDIAAALDSQLEVSLRD